MSSSAPWPTVPLRDICTPVDRRTSETPAHVLMISSRVGFVSQSDKYSRFMAGKSLAKYITLRRGEFAYNRGNSQLFPAGCVYRLTQYDAGAVPFVYTCFSVDSALADARYLDHFFRAGGLTTQLKALVNIGVRNNGLLNISSDTFFGCRVPLPDRSVQGRIADLLDACDEGIVARHAVLAQLREVRQALLAELLPASAGTQEANSGCERGVLLDSLARRGSGHTPRKTEPEYWNGGIKWLSLADSASLDRVFVQETEAQISAAGIANSSAVEHPVGTVVVSRDGARVGKSAVLAEPMAVSQHFISWTCGPQLHNLYLYYVLQSKKHELARVSTGSTTNRSIGLPYFRSLRIDVPPLDRQHLVARVLLSVDERVFAEERALSSAESAREAIRSALFGGELGGKLAQRHAAA